MAEGALFAYSICAVQGEGQDLQTHTRVYTCQGDGTVGDIQRIAVRKAVEVFPYPQYTHHSTCVAHISEGVVSSSLRGLRIEQVARGKYILRSDGAVGTEIVEVVRVGNTKVLILFPDGSESWVFPSCLLKRVQPPPVSGEHIS